MINIYLNNEKYQVKANESLQAFLLAHHYMELHFAIAINNQLIPRAAYGTTLLHENDRIDLIVPMQGG
ncbi:MULTISPECIES: sulfur carrier protein ThiS [Legionella]|uniref:Thiamine biosynthesis sulfur transport protein ThiS n=1 Tax=Legionella maceachernii TaxID=466 RepID=A0A0W0VVJ8_9GAMM|nr:sulfur carrier protein ThiS [Legionella maceachernii]KTD24037.1 Thiamine biosynthesis sulfur transport protein ThiS [Legionella maceachernii]SJZ84598.1 sulfur carrier protein [Legionella maceachernii]SUO99284.1 sulfur carrier protein ThiS [Legionella maceachernii]